MQNINERVEVGFNNYPRWIKWQDRIYKVEKVGLHHTYREGKVLYHIFSLTTNTLFMRLSLNTDTLNWTLEETEEKFTI